MREMLRCALDGRDFLSVDPRLYLEDIEEQIKTRGETAARAGGGSVLVGGAVREALTVTLRFMIKEKDRARRAAVISRVNAWARRGWLTVSTRPWQRLYVVCTQPAAGEAMRWSEEMRVALTAFDRPFWSDAIAVTAGIAGSAGQAALCPGGTRRCLLEADITNRSGNTVNTLRLEANGCALEFNDLGLNAGKTLRLAYDGRGLLHAGIDGAGKLDCRTAASDDGIPLLPGRSNAVQFSADGACGVTLYARGEYD